LIFCITSSREEVPALRGIEEIADIADGVDEIVVGSHADAPQVGLEL